MKASAAGLALGVLVTFADRAPLAQTPLPSDVLPYSGVRAGMKGSGRTVFKGETSELFDVEILGKLDRIGPGQNLILARLTSPVLAGTGVLEGMSGSPVYLDGKMIGAVAYSWGFAREAIAGITPIEEMLSIPLPVPRESPWSAAGTASTRSRLASLGDLAATAARYDAALAGLAGNGRVPSAVSRLGLPLAASGLSSEWLSRHLGDGNRALRIHVAGSTTAGSSTVDASPAALSAGDAVGARLVQGDIELTAFGTVTRVDGDRVLAFGHPFLQLGPVEFPMTRARVETLLPSLNSSFKIASSTGEAGAFYQDRSSGISGRLGAKARMVPVRLQVLSPSRSPRSFAYEVTADPLLTPILLYITLGGILETTEKGVGEASVELKDGSVLLLDKDRKADVSNLFAGEGALPSAAAMLGLITEVLLQNEFEEVRLEGVNLIVGFTGERREARIMGAWTDKNQVRPGDTVVLSVALKPYRQPETLETIPIEIPQELPPGRFTIHVGDARSLTRIEQAGAGGLLPLDLENLLSVINTLRKNRSLAILGTREEPSLLIGADPFPNLPPSKSSLILRRQGRGSFPVLRTRPVLDESRDTDFAIEGYRRVDLEVVR